MKPEKNDAAIRGIILAFSIVGIIYFLALITGVKL